MFSSVDLDIKESDWGKEKNENERKEKKERKEREGEEEREKCKRKDTPTSQSNQGSQIDRSCQPRRILFWLFFLNFLEYGGHWRIRFEERRSHLVYAFCRPRNRFCRRKKGLWER